MNDRLTTEPRLLRALNWDCSSPLEHPSQEGRQQGKYLPIPPKYLMKEPFDIGGPLVLKAQPRVGAPQAGLRPRSEVPNIGGPLVILPEFELAPLLVERRSLDTVFEGGLKPSVKTDIF